MRARISDGLRRLRPLDPGAALVAEPPVTVGDLATRLGVGLDALLPGVTGIPVEVRPGVRVAFAHAWDVHHQEPVRTQAELGRSRLQRVVLELAVGDRVENALRRRYGPPVDVCERRRHGPFLVSGGRAGDSRLEWYANEPDWAKPAPDEAARAAALGAFAALAGRAPDKVALAAAVRATPRAAGIVPAAGEAALALDPPMPARAVAGALGLPGAIARTVDVHMAHWVLCLPDPPGTRPPTLGVWHVDVALAGSPTGGAADGIRVPAAAVARLGEADLARTVVLRCERS